MEEDPLRHVEVEKRAYWWREQNRQRQEAGELEHAGATADEPGSQGWVAWKAGLLEFPRAAQQGWKRANGHGKTQQPGQTTVIPHSEAFTQLPDGQTGKNYLHGDSQASGEMTPAA